MTIFFPEYTAKLLEDWNPSENYRDLSKEPLSCRITETFKEGRYILDRSILVIGPSSEKRAEEIEKLNGMHSSTQVKALLSVAITIGSIASAVFSMKDAIRIGSIVAAGIGLVGTVLSLNKLSNINNATIAWNKYPAQELAEKRAHAYGNGGLRYIMQNQLRGTYGCQGINQLLHPAEVEALYHEALHQQIAEAESTGYVTSLSHQVDFVHKFVNDQLLSIKTIRYAIMDSSLDRASLESWSFDFNRFQKEFHAYEQDFAMQKETLRQATESHIADIKNNLAATLSAAWAVKMSADGSAYTKAALLKRYENPIHEKALQKSLKQHQQIYDAARLTAITFANTQITDARGKELLGYQQIDLAKKTAITPFFYGAVQLLRDLRG